MKWLLGCLFFVISSSLFAQQGIIIGNVIDEKNKALEGASVQLASLKDSQNKKIVATDKNGYFEFDLLPFDHYRLSISFVGLQSVTIDSIHVRTERFDFNLGDVVLKTKTTDRLAEIIIYAEKPLIQTKDGNITYNAGESALSNGSNASDLLTNVPLVTKDPNGKVLVRGKEPKILIDDKPVELNLQQLQDLLESMPGSSIEKIEVMTNPPAQYANEHGGVINIVTRKGAIGVGGRLTIYAGTRGEVGGNASFNYRKRGLVFSLNAGGIRNVFNGYGYSDRENLYLDSTNRFKTNNEYTNKSTRPNIRMNLDYELNKFHSVNLVFQYNQNSFNNNNSTAYRNLNYLGDTYRLSRRTIGSAGDNYSPGINLSYLLRTKRAGENLRIHTAANFSDNNSIRQFYEQYYSSPDFITAGSDSVQNQVTDNRIKGYNVRLNYDRPFGSRNRTNISVGGFYHYSRSLIKTDAAFKRKADGEFVPLDALSNHFLFRQYVSNLRASMKQVIGPDFSTTAGVAAEETRINFDLFKSGSDTANSYWTFLPFATINKTWKDVLNISIAYRRTIRRPGIGELNPTIDFADPYNIRFGNPDLEASTSHNFDLVVGRTKNNLYANVGFGYNIVDDIFSQIRSLRSDGKTEVTWQNISGRKEYEVSTWSGYTITKKLRLNVSASYTYNVYSDYDKEHRRFRDGGSLTSNLNTNYSWKDLYIATGSFTLNRFANPQGRVKSNLSMNLGLQARLLNKKLTVTLNAIDPFTQQQNKVFTYGRSFNLESFSSTQTRSYRLTLNYNLTKTAKPRKKIDAQKKMPAKVPVS